MPILIKLNSLYQVLCICLPSETSSKYFIGYTHQTDNIYSTATGSVLLAEDNFLLGVHNDKVVAYNQTDINSTDSVTSVVKLYGTQSDLPVSELYKAS